MKNFLASISNFFLFLPTILAKLVNYNSQCWQRCREMNTSIYSLQIIEIYTTTKKADNMYQVLKMKIYFDPENLLLKYYPNKMMCTKINLKFVIHIIKKTKIMCLCFHRMAKKTNIFIQHLNVTVV